MITPSELGLKESTIHKLIDFVLLNSCSVNSSGLYNGKAGIALTLFEVSRYFQNEYIEEEAFNLLQQALLNKNEDISFENGLSGIGFVLLYLLENKFIDGDFNELFGDNSNIIIHKLSEIEENSSDVEIIFLFKTVYFLSFLGAFMNHEKAIHFIRIFSERTDILLEKCIADFQETRNGYMKELFFSFFEVYLEISAYSSSFFTPSLHVLERYAELYRKNKLICSFQIGYYLEEIAIKWNNSKPPIKYPF